MSMEIELKAHIDNHEALKNLLAEKAEYLSAFEKEDRYYFLPEQPYRFPSGVRVRREKRTFTDGTEKSTSIVTYKEKMVRDGIEVNDEREFEVQSTEEFEEFLDVMRFKPGTSKKKRGWAFCRDGITAELVEVEGLGWFVELEIIVKSSHADVIDTVKNLEETFADERNRLLGFLDSLGVSRESIESRFYSQMINCPHS